MASEHPERPTPDDGDASEVSVPDYGDPEQNRCVNCEARFRRSATECPECGCTHYGYWTHPVDEWTTELAKNVLRASAGYLALWVRLPADGQAVLWWDDGLEAYSTYPTGAWDSFSFGIDDTLEEARRIELRHWRDVPDGRIRHEMRPPEAGGSRG